MRGTILVQDLEYADDMAVVCDSISTLEEVLRSLDEVCTSAGLSINSEKTKVLAIHSSVSLGVLHQPCPSEAK